MIREMTLSGESRSKFSSSTPQSRSEISHRLRYIMSLLIMTWRSQFPGSRNQFENEAAQM